MVVAGGTGVMAGRNAGAAAAPLLDLSRVGALTQATHVAAVVRLGACVTYTHVIERLAGPLPGVAAAARTVASRAIRNRATLAGALVLADPSADVLAALVAAEAQVELEGPDGVRRVAALAFVRGPGDPDLRDDELVTALLIPAAPGPTAYAKAGARNAMARAVCGVAVALDPARRTVRIAVVGVAPTAVRAREAEALAAELGAWDRAADASRMPAFDFSREEQPAAVGGGAGAEQNDILAEIAALVAGAVDPTGDERGSRAHRRRIAGVLARRAISRAWAQLEPVPG